MELQVVPKRRSKTTLCRVTFQKTEELTVNQLTDVILFTVNVATLRVSHTTKCRMVRLVTTELERM